jgi:Flp pilus assembly protein TadG
VEAAIVLPVLFTLMLGLIVGAMGIFQYQQMAALAREGARYASVHGGQYKSETGNAYATQATVLSEGILPKAGGLDTSRLGATVSWTNTNATSGPMPTYLYDTTNNIYRRNWVTVTVTYQWSPLMIFPNVTLSSTAKMAQAY